MLSMNILMPYFLVLAMAATLGVLVLGVVSFAVHGEFYRRHSNHLMQLRVLFQGIALAVLATILFIYTN